MHFECLGAFRELEGDEDNFDKFLRILRATYWTALTGTLWLMFGSAWAVGYEGRSYEHDPVGILFYSILFFLFYCSHTFFFSSSPRRHFLGPSIVALASAAGEAATVLGWWNLGQVLGWWRMAILIVAMAWLQLWACEKAVQLRRSRQKGLGSPG